VVIFLKFARVERFVAVLCLVLALVYAGASASQAINTMQHSAAQEAAHEHSVLSDALEMRGSHHADDGPADLDNDQTQHDVAGGHHHHGDTGPSLLATSANELPGVMLFSNSRAPARDRRVDGIAVPGPERPPMVLKLAA